MHKETNEDTYTLSFSHEIARTRGYEKNEDGSKKKDNKDEYIPIIIRPDLPEPAKDRQFTLQCLNVPNAIPESIMHITVSRYIYGHGSYIASTLFDVFKLKIGEVVQFDYTTILEWSEEERERTGGTSEQIKIYRRWIGGKLTEVDWEAIRDPETGAELKAWMENRRKIEIVKEQKKAKQLTGASLD